MKTKYVCRGLNSLYVYFHNNRMMWSLNLHVKNCRWGGGGKEKEPNFFLAFISRLIATFLPHFKSSLFLIV